MLADLPPERRNAYLAGAAITLVWLIASVLYITLHVGWTSLDFLLLHEQALVVLAVFVPLVFLWLALAFGSQALELRSSTDRISIALSRLTYPAEEAEDRVRVVTESLRGQARDLNEATDRSAAQAQRLRDLLQVHA